MAKGKCASITTAEDSAEICTDQSVNCPTSYLDNLFFVFKTVGIKGVDRSQFQILR